MINLGLIAVFKRVIIDDKIFRRPCFRPFRLEIDCARAVPVSIHALFQRRKYEKNVCLLARVVDEFLEFRES